MQKVVHVLVLSLFVFLPISCAPAEEASVQEVPENQPTQINEPCSADLDVRTTADGVEFVRTPDACFENLPDWQYEAQYVDIDGLRQAYVDVGPADADPILLLHGQPSWSYLYRHMIPVLAEAGHRVIAMDHLGMGRSDKPVDLEYHSFLNHTSRLEGLIQELALENITLFAQDWGSLIGLYVVGTNPDWFDRVIIGNGALPMYEEGTIPFQLPEDIETSNAQFSLIFDTIPARQPSFYDNQGNLLVEPYGDGNFGSWIVYAMHDEGFQASKVVEAMTYFELSEEERVAYDAPFPSRITMGAPRSFPSLVNTLPGVTQVAWEGLASFEKPFLTIWGGNDPGQLGQPETQQLLIDQIPGANGQNHDRLPEASHFLQDDQGAEIARRINTFITDTSTDEEAQVDWYESIVPSKHYDSARTHRFPEAQFLGNLNGGNSVQAQSFEGVFPSPYNIVTRDDGELFVYGGGYGEHPLATGAFVARLDSDTRTEIWRTELINTDETGDWNYPGVIGIHANGDLYVIYGYRMARLDPETGDVRQERELPTSDNAQDTSYNGFTVLSDGTIIAKTISRAAGCAEQGFNALLRCPGRNDVSPSLVVAIDPETLIVHSQITASEPTFGRITSGRFGGVDYIYTVGFDTLFRYRYLDGQLTYDETWGPVPYRLGNQTAASATALLGDFVVLQTNAVPTRTPLSVVVVSQQTVSRLYHSFLQWSQLIPKIAGFTPMMVVLAA